MQSRGAAARRISSPILGQLELNCFRTKLLLYSYCTKCFRIGSTVISDLFGCDIVIRSSKQALKALRRNGSCRQKVDGSVGALSSDNSREENGSLGSTLRLGW